MKSGDLCLLFLECCLFPFFSETWDFSITHRVCVLFPVLCFCLSGSSVAAVRHVWEQHRLVAREINVYPYQVIFGGGVLTVHLGSEGEHRAPVAPLPEVSLSAAADRGAVVFVRLQVLQHHGLQPRAGEGVLDRTRADTASSHSTPSHLNGRRQEFTLPSL